MHYVMKAEAARVDTTPRDISHSAGEIKPLFDDTGAILKKAICIAYRDMRKSCASRAENRFGKYRRGRDAAPCVPLARIFPKNSMASPSRRVDNYDNANLNRAIAREFDEKRYIKGGDILLCHKFCAFYPMPVSRNANVPA